MKKLLSVAALLMIALLFFTGCAKDADPNALPGAWSPSAEQYGSFTATFGGKGTLVQSGTNQYTFSVDTAEIPDANKPTAGRFSWWVKNITTDPIYTGFKATVTSTADTYYGFSFNCTTTSDQWSYYAIFFHSNKFLINKIVNDSPTTIISWTPNTAINEAPTENEILIYKDAESNIVIKANGTEIYKLTSPQLTIGKCGVVLAVSDVDCNAGREISTLYTFKEFQR